MSWLCSLAARRLPTALKQRHIGADPTSARVWRSFPAALQQIRSKDFRRPSSLRAAPQRSDSLAALAQRCQLEIQTLHAVGRMRWQALSRCREAPPSRPETLRKGKVARRAAGDLRKRRRTAASQDYYSITEWCCGRRLARRKQSVWTGCVVEAGHAAGWLWQIARPAVSDRMPHLPAGGCLLGALDESSSGCRRQHPHGRVGLLAAGIPISHVAIAPAGGRRRHGDGAASAQAPQERQSRVLSGRQPGAMDALLGWCW